MKATENGSKTKSIVAIDADRLDEEWIRQPDRYLEYAEELAEAKFELDRAKATLDVNKAEAELEIRKDPQKFWEGKVTEDTVKALVKTHEDVVAQTEILNKKSYRVNILEARVTAFEHRKRSLENLVQLQAQGYFARPREPKGSDYDKKVIRSHGRK